MRKIYVQNDNYLTFMAAVEAVENSGSEEAKILFLTSEPGCGKTAAVDRFGSEVDAILLEGMPKMSVAFTRDYLAERLGVVEKGSFNKHKEIINKLADRGTPIILDEAQHAAKGQADPLEFLRRVAEQAGVMLVLVCHTKERSLFTEAKMAHINTRITAKPVFVPADFNNCKQYMTERCEVGFDDAVVKRVLDQSRGRYRIINNAIVTLEGFAKFKGTDLVTGEMVANMRLCEEIGKAL